MALHHATVSDVELYKESAADSHPVNKTGDGRAFVDYKLAKFFAPVHSESKLGVRTQSAGDVNGENFRKWFAGSKVVDADGNPLVVYRGASFDPLAQEPGNGVIRPESYFSADPEYAKRYGKVNAYYLRITKPFDVRNPEDAKRLSEFYPAGYKVATGQNGTLEM